MKNHAFLLSGRGFSVRFSSLFFLWGLGMGVLFLPSCRQEEEDYGAGQRAHYKETELRNKTLLEQFVLASEELENHSDAVYFENALTRLNPWLVSCTASRDFRPSEEYAQKQVMFQNLAQTAEIIASVCLKARSEGEGNTDVLTDEDLKNLSEGIDRFLEQIRALNADFHSPLMARYEAMASDLKSNTAEAGTFQFGNQGKMVAAAIARFPFTPLMNFQMVARGAAKLAQLYQLDARSFFPEDTSHFKSAVWERNIVSWAKGNDSDPNLQTLSLFQWVCDALPLRNAAAQTITGDVIPQQAWQTLLTSQANGPERAVVFMGLLRQIGVTSFVIRPVTNQPKEFPLMVGAVLPDSDPAKPSVIRIFLPEYGIPLPGADSPILVNEEGKTKGLRFSSAATLEEAAGDDMLLRRLDLPDHPFPLTASDLAEVKALIPTDMFNMSERMWIMMRESVIDQTESGSEQAASFVPPMLALSFDSVRTEIVQLSHIAGVEHGWEFQAPIVDQVFLPFESQILLLPYLYEVQATSGLSIRSDSDSSQKYAPTEGAGSDTQTAALQETKMVTPLWEGKILYFKGLFDKENGAANRLQQGRIPDRLLKQANMELGNRLEEYMQQVQESQAGNEGNFTEEQLRAVAAQFINQNRQDLSLKLFLKVTARFNLGLVSRALMNDEAAMNHLEDGDLLTKLDGMWKSGTLTLLAEIYESRGDFARAEKIYERLEGPAAAGGKLRAKWLRELSGE